MQRAAEKFGKDLKDLVLARGTIAQACKETGINRQQFNKYLAGQIMPGVRTMRKICSYLSVTEEQLMSGRIPAVARALSSDHTENDLGLEALTARPGHQAELRNGFYSAYFPVRGHPNLVARWLVHVMDGPNGTQIHTCRNRFRDAAAMGYSADHIRYRGPVVYGPDEASLIGTARTPLPLRGNIFVNLQPVVGREFFSAMVLTRRPDGPIALSGVMKFLGADCTARSALAGMGIVSLDDPAADPIIVRLMRATPAAGTNWMQSITEKNLRAGPEGSNHPKILAFRRLSV
jgi:transcriptional regulator with XRE-family HTH domain